MNVTSPVALTDPVRAFLAEPNYATLATIAEDGTPHQAVIWYRLDADERILINSRSPRRWPSELGRDPRCSLAVIDRADSMRWVGLQAVLDSVVEEIEAAREDIVALAVRYGDDDPATFARFRSQPRISFRLRIVGVHDHLED
jgi:PPOX class probable F420-dependent enzyme